MINNGRNDWEEYQRSFLPYLCANRVPYKGTFELTPLCNFYCNMCYVRLDEKQMKLSGRLLSAEEWIRIAQSAVNNGLLVAELTGGEAFTRADFQYIYESFYSMGLLINLRTNGYLLDVERLDWLSDKKPNSISITLYGASDETYKKVCGISDGFTTVSNNILRLVDRGFNVILTMTMTKDNELDFKPLADWCHKHNLVFTAYAGLLQPFKNTGRSVAGKKVDFAREKYHSVLLDETAYTPPKDYVYAESPFARCLSYGCKFSVSWNGRLTICNTMQSIYEDVLNTDFISAYKRLYNRLDQLKRPAKCCECKYDPFCENCPPKLENKSGNPEETTDQVCEEAKERYYNYLYSLQKINDGKL